MYSVYNYDTGYDFWKDLDIDFTAKGEYSSYLYQKRVSQLIKSSEDSGKPFIIYLPFQSVHRPNQVPQEMNLSLIFVPHASE